MAKTITGSNIRSKAMQHEIHLQKTMLIVETGSEFSKPESNFVHKRGIISTKIYGIIECLCVISLKMLNIFRKRLEIDDVLIFIDVFIIML